MSSLHYLRDHLAEYVSHKRVRAGEIVAVHPYEPPGSPSDFAAFTAQGLAATVIVALANGSLWQYPLNHEQWNRGGHTPQVGDRLVIYGKDDDLYLSISPKKAFEEGYALVQKIKNDGPSGDLEIIHTPDGKVTTLGFEHDGGIVMLPDGKLQCLQCDNTDTIDHPLAMSYVEWAAARVRGDDPSLASINTDFLVKELVRRGVVPTTIRAETDQRDVRWAMQQMQNGKKVMRPLWGECFLYIDPPASRWAQFVILRVAGRKLAPWLPEHNDLLATDWMLVP